MHFENLLHTTRQKANAHPPVNSIVNKYSLALKTLLLLLDINCQVKSFQIEKDRRTN
jgi:hypothetical protein